MLRLKRRLGDRGAAAVEMALVLPVLLLVLGGLIDLGRAFFGQIIVANAANEAARMVALRYPAADVTTRAVQATAGLTPLVTSSTATVTTVATCPASIPVGTYPAGSVVVTAPNFRWMVLNVVPRLVGGNVPTPVISGRASMRCTA